jgi:hypothetical protein
MLAMQASDVELICLRLTAHLFRHSLVSLRAGCRRLGPGRLAKMHSSQEP